MSIFVPAFFTFLSEKIKYILHNKYSLNDILYVFWSDSSAEMYLEC